LRCPSRRARPELIQARQGVGRCAREVGWMRDTLVLNASFEPLSTVTLNRAVVLVLQDKAVVEQAHPELRMRGAALDIPRDLVGLVRDPDDDIRMVFAQSGYSRIPVYRETLDEIVGMLHAFDLFKLQPGDPLPVRPVAVTPGSRSCGDLLLDMQRERRHLAVVLDEFGGTLGIATLEDLLEELVGEIFDEHDEEVRHAAAAGPALFETDGNVPPEAIEERFGVSLPSGRSTTIAGLVVEWAGRIPNPGERFLIRGLEVDVIQASPTRIERLIIRSGTTPALPLPSVGP